MTVDPEIRSGDVVHDLVERGKMQVIEKAADSVAAYREREDFDLAEYKSHPLLDVSAHEPVYTCVYLPDSPTTSFSGTYDFPRSRLARVPVEEANQDLERIQDAQTIDLLARLMVAGEEWSDPDTFDEVALLAKDAGIAEDLVTAARELADVERTIGGDEA